MKGFKFFTHVCDCSVKTELIGKDNYAKNSLNCFLICSKVNRQFSVSFAFDLPWTMELLHGKLGTRFQRIPIASFPRYDPKFLVDYSLSEPGPINDHCPIPNFFASMETTLAFAKHSSSLPLLSQEMSLNIDINRTLPVKFLVFLLICSVDLSLYRRAATW